MTNLLELAERCEAAEAIEQRNLIREAGRLAFGKASVRYARFCDLVNVGAFLDAAMMLVPEGRRFTIGFAAVPNLAGYQWFAAIEGGGGTGKGVVPALALCAAALRARAPSSPNQEQEQ